MKLLAVGAFVFYYFAASFLLTLFDLILIQGYLALLVPTIVTTILHLIIPILVVLAAVRLAELLVKQTFPRVIKFDNKFLIITCSLYAIIIYSLIAQGFLRGKEANYQQVIFYSSVKFVEFLLASLFWFNRNSKLVRKFLKT